MATTPRQLIDAAYGYSKLNQPNSSATELSELLPVIQRRLRGYFAEAARHNRKIFGAKATVAFATDGWPRPKAGAPVGCNGVEMITRIEVGSGMTAVGGGALAAGTEIVEVPFDQRTIEPGKPCVYAWGQKYYSVGGTKDPSGAGNIVFWYSTRPAEIATLTSELDALWPEQFNDLLVLDVARYLARKDGGERRAGEMVALQGEYDEVHARWLMWLQHESITEVRDFDHYSIRNNPGVKVG